MRPNAEGWSVKSSAMPVQARHAKPHCASGSLIAPVITQPTLSRRRPCYFCTSGRVIWTRNGGDRIGLKPGAILSDVGSVKASVIAQAQPHLPSGVHLVPAHPIAGTEHSGPESGFAELFDDRWCILTPLADGDADALKTVEAFWTGLGSKVDIMDAEHHDRVLAVTSHIPHLIAYTIVGTASDLESVTGSEVIKYSAAGFRDFTRIAASDPTMWRDVFLHNKDATLEVLGRLTEDLFALQRAIRLGDGDALYEQFERTRAIRRSIVEAGEDTAAPDFGRIGAKHND
ncbi:UNVERIFIED_CONTAM: hypothetical protein GTU68_001277 [Idotea baltica]|nr:hypothetical protein [Idotea baltica]